MVNFFDKFYKDSEHFNKPFTKSSVKHPYTMEMVKEALDCLSNMSGLKIHKKCRVYVEGTLISPFEAKDFIIKISRYKNMESINWETLVNGKSFVIFLNYAGLFSNKLMEASRVFLGDFGTHFEPQGIFIEHHIIIGKYKETPFGVHLDDSTSRVFHFNLGPFPKKMILWPREDFLAKYNKDATRPFHTVSTKDSITYDINVGGTFLLPSNYYHVGKSSLGVSVMVSLALTTQSYELQFNAFCEMLRIFAQIEEDPNKYYKNFAFKANVKEFYKRCNKALNIGFETLLEHARALRRSNNYFVEISSLDTSCISTKLSTYKIVKPCSLQMLQRGNKLYLYSRGHYSFLTKLEHISTFKTYIQKGIFDFSLEIFWDAFNKGDKGTALLGWLITTKMAKKL